MTAGAAAVERFHRTVLRNPWIPERHRRVYPKQAAFLLHADTREVLYGGAAGGGKSNAILCAALQFVDRPEYSALLVMRTLTDMRLRDSLGERLGSWLEGTAARWDGGASAWVFPSGASITLGHLSKQRAEQRYRGPSFNFIAFDELTRFEEGQYRFLFSRLRKPEGSDIPTRMRAATNPGDAGHEWVKARFVPPAYLALRDADARFSRVWWNGPRLFVPARLEDNPSLDADDYEESQKELPPVVWERMRYGDWSAHADGHVKREWLRTYRDSTDHWYVEHTGEVAVKSQCVTLVCLDPAGGTSEAACPSAIVCVAVTPLGSLLVLEVVRERLAVEEVVPRLADVCLRRRPLLCLIEGGFLQSQYVRQARQTHGIPTVQEMDPRGLGDKLVRGTPLILRAKEGGLCLPCDPRHWTDAYISEVCSFTGDEKKDGFVDQFDATAWVVVAVDQLGLGRQQDDAPAAWGRRGSR